MLSDRTIQNLRLRGELDITTGDIDDDPMESGQLQPVSVDLRLGGLSHRNGYQRDEFRSRGYLLAPLRFMLGCTIEWVRLSSNLVGKVEGKSTRARQGLIVEAAGLVDPGFHGQLTLEIFNMSEEHIHLEHGMRICQMYLEWVDATPNRSYGDPALGNHYQGQQGPTAARLS